MSTKKTITDPQQRKIKQLERKIAELQASERALEEHVQITEAKLKEAISHWQDCRKDVVFWQEQSKDHQQRVIHFQNLLQKELKMKYRMQNDFSSHSKYTFLETTEEAFPLYLVDEKQTEEIRN